MMQQLKGFVNLFITLVLNVVLFSTLTYHRYLHMFSECKSIFASKVDFCDRKYLQPNLILINKTTIIFISFCNKINVDKNNLYISILTIADNPTITLDDDDAIT